jgi:hypothetical protein
MFICYWLFSVNINGSIEIFSSLLTLKLAFESEHEKNDAPFPKGLTLSAALIRSEPTMMVV